MQEMCNGDKKDVNMVSTWGKDAKYLGSFGFVLIFPTQQTNKVSDHVTLAN